MKPLMTGDQVAIMPMEKSPAQDVLEIATTRYVGSVYIELEDGRKYATIGGKWLSNHAKGYAVPVTAEHRSALDGKLATA